MLKDFLLVASKEVLSADSEMFLVYFAWNISIEAGSTFLFSLILNNEEICFWCLLWFYISY